MHSSRFTKGFAEKIQIFGAGKVQLVRQRGQAEADRSAASRREALPASRTARIVEIGPQDGLQNEASQLPAALKVAVAARPGAAGSPFLPVMRSQAAGLDRMRHKDDVDFN